MGIREMFQALKRTKARTAGWYLRPLVLIGLLAGLTATQTPALAAPSDFTIGIPGKTGCLVCHGDPKLTQVKAKRSLYISDIELMSSVHKELACVKCHTDFNPASAAQSHQGLTTDSRTIAGLACKNCHEHSKQLKIYDKSIHGRLTLGGDSKAPTCADCHGAHGIKSFKKNAAYKQEFHATAAQVCGQCHQDYYEAYNDYYHGAAYKTDAPDAPACWDCHGSHEILPAKDSTSKVADRNLAKTCGSCHADSHEPFVAFADMIHGRPKLMKKNIVIKYKDMLVTWFSDKVSGKVSANAAEKNGGKSGKK
ncbi:MAG: hypothetical protein WC891_01465 [Actinomycetota bacterium]